MLTKKEFLESSGRLNVAYANVFGSPVYDTQDYELFQKRLRDSYPPEDWLRLPDNAILMGVIERWYRQTELEYLILIENILASHPLTSGPIRPKFCRNLVRICSGLIRGELRNGGLKNGGLKNGRYEEVILPPSSHP